ncbi:MAG: alpha/beta hydrolase [Prosthecochloris sp.]|nr:alpha/beta hydrolase [Prosthecochloris sp.]
MSELSHGPETRKFRRYRAKLQSLKSSPHRSEQLQARYLLDLARTSRFVELNGVVHHYHDSGPHDGRGTILLIHGWDCWWLWWHHVIRVLNREGYRTIAYDLRGHGWSERDTGGNYSTDVLTDDFTQLVDYLDLEAFHVAAFSYGPVIALQYAHRCPGKVQSMVLFNFGLSESGPVVEQIAPAIITFTFNSVLRQVGWWLPVYMFARLVLSRNTVLKSDILMAFDSLGLCDPKAIEQTTREIASVRVAAEVRRLVREIEVPVLFAAGEGDPIMTCENTRKLADLSASARFCCVPDCGHLMTIELPETASQLILDHVSRVAS